MLSIFQMPNFGFGNRVLYYYNLRQFANLYKTHYYCVPWYGMECFEGDLIGHPPKENDSIKIVPPCLGEHFFTDSGVCTRDVYKLKKRVTLEPNSCAVHFRGTDFHQWNPDSILSSQYYLNAIEEVSDSVNSFYIFTDDRTLKSYQDVKKYLSDKKISYVEGENTPNRLNFINDFAILSQCDILISSPSTFCICAGFIGKHKKIIHSKKWVKGRVDREDGFWVGLHNGGNQDYSAWKYF